MSRFPKIPNSTDAQIVLLEAYENAYGIFNHNGLTDRERPLALIAHHPCEDSFLGSVLYERMQQFVDSDVYQKTGISMERFLELPREYTMGILKLCTKRKSIENADAAKVLKELEDKLGVPSGNHR